MTNPVAATLLRCRCGHSHLDHLGLGDGPCRRKACGCMWFRHDDRTTMTDPHTTPLPDEHLLQLVTMALEDTGITGPHPYERLAAAALAAVREHDAQPRILREHLLAAADIVAVHAPSFADHLRHLVNGHGG